MIRRDQSQTDNNRTQMFCVAAAGTNILHYKSNHVNVRLCIAFQLSNLLTFSFSTNAVLSLEGTENLRL